MAENDTTADETTEDHGDSGGDAGDSGGFLGRFSGGFATIAGGAAAFVLMLIIGGFVAFQLLGGPGDGAAPGPVAASGPSNSSGSGGSSGSNDAAEQEADPPSLQNPDSVIEPDDQSSSEEPQPGNQPEDTQPASFKLVLSKEAAEPFENIVWRGNYPGRQGLALVLQNKQGPNWVDYREEATVQGNGRYKSTFSVGATGVNEFRAVDPRSGQVSNVVKVEIF